jgi:hypothetical protein
MPFILKLVSKTWTEQMKHNRIAISIGTRVLSSESSKAAVLGFPFSTRNDDEGAYRRRLETYKLRTQVRAAHLLRIYASPLFFPPGRILDIRSVREKVRETAEDR